MGFGFRVSEIRGTLWGPYDKGILPFGSPIFVNPCIQPRGRVLINPQYEVVHNDHEHVPEHLEVPQTGYSV